MALRPTWLSIVSLSVLAATLAVTDANARTLFDILFGGGSKRFHAQDFPSRTQHTMKRTREGSSATSRITGPGYNAYKADRLVKVDFSGLSNGLSPVAYQPSADPVRFAEAVANLADYELLAERDVAAALTGVHE